MNATTANIQALKEYSKINVQTSIENASPHRLIQMLMDGALTSLAQAKGHMKADAIVQKGEAISMAVSIIGGLRDSLDHEQGGSLADNLDSLYEYMTYRLMESNLKNDASLLDEVHDLLTEIKSAWDAIANHPTALHGEAQLEQPAA